MKTEIKSSSLDMKPEDWRTLIDGFLTARGFKGSPFWKPTEVSFTLHPNGSATAYIESKAL